MAREGMTRNAIAREVGVSPSTVSNLCASAKPPIHFDRSATKVAVQAAVLDAKARRGQISEGLLDDVTTIRARLFSPIERTHHSVTDGTVRYEAPPTPGEIRELATALGILLDKHLVLVKTDSDDRDLPALDAWLDSLGVGEVA